MWYKQTDRLKHVHKVSWWRYFRYQRVKNGNSHDRKISNKIICYIDHYEIWNQIYVTVISCYTVCCVWHHDSELWYLKVLWVRISWISTVFNMGKFDILIGVKFMYCLCFGILCEGISPSWKFEWRHWWEHDFSLRTEYVFVVINRTLIGITVQRRVTFKCLC